ncbi:hypothetical protein [Bacillus cereus]|uniref:Uncharacterized protein n=1 Tax=Bacillus cereus TaxID=1396 RepID=A0A164QCX4_BACCE|nr:hypothetical protein [Bacillus cereus]KZD70969.1 hypothetical protein B4088_1025 [Bacillus cereus]
MKKIKAEYMIDKIGRKWLNATHKTLGWKAQLLLDENTRVLTEGKDISGEFLVLKEKPFQVQFIPGLVPEKKRDIEKDSKEKFYRSKLDGNPAVAEAVRLEKKIKETPNGIDSSAELLKEYDAYIVKKTVIDLEMAIELFFEKNVYDTEKIEWLQSILAFRNVEKVREEMNRINDKRAQIKGYVSIPYELAKHFTLENKWDVLKEEYGGKYEAIRKEWYVPSQLVYKAVAGLVGGSYKIEDAINTFYVSWEVDSSLKIGDVNAMVDKLPSKWSWNAPTQVFSVSSDIGLVGRIDKSESLSRSPMSYSEEDVISVKNSKFLIVRAGKFGDERVYKQLDGEWYQVSSGVYSVPFFVAMNRVYLKKIVQ